MSDLPGMLSGLEERNLAATRAYEALKAIGQLRSHRVLTVRCSSRCLLLDVLLTPAGVIVASPRYKLSHDMNERTTSPDGRQRNTEDGDRHWKARASFASDAINFTMNCDHVRNGVLRHDDLQRALDAGEGEIRWSV